MRLNKDITFGKYSPGDSLIHRLDPRAKVFTTVIFLSAVFVTRTWIGYATWGLLLVIAYRFSAIPGIVLLKNLRPFLFLFLFTFLWHTLFLPSEGEILLQIGQLEISKSAVNTAVVYCLRIGMFIIISSLLTLTTAPLEFTDAIEKSLALLKRVNVPVHEFALMTSIAIRFIPTILDEAEKLYLVQSNRGARFDGSLMERVYALLALVVPLLTTTFLRAEELAVAMEARCYDNQSQRTIFKRLNWTYKDTTILAGGCLVSAFVLGFEYLN
ncbi:energy-coupling factor transporter transmembrane protein EcfT [candidate division KSB1 bacterium]|nr:energy-coupling factor transporter transmembrane protein EcfT [candidate division KSB1 bacterium]